MQLIPYLIAFVAGLLLTVQVGLNATLGRAVGNVHFAVLANFTVGLAGILLYIVAARDAWPTREGLATVPMWAWFGGFLGAFYVAVATIVGPRIGAAALLALTVFGQLLASMLVDQFGWLGFPMQPISPTKIAGAVLLLGGVALIVR
jgi:bacterial/archaeal transporter family-2 protein